MTHEGKKVLVVDDEEPLQQALRDTLSREGFNVLTAKNGDEGLKTALEQHPDLILLDFIMPKMDGMTMLKQLRLDGWGKLARVVILTNLSDNEKIADAMNSETFDYFVKSDTKIHELVKKIKEKLA